MDREDEDLLLDYASDGDDRCDRVRGCASEFGCPFFRATCLCVHGRVFSSICESAKHDGHAPLVWLCFRAAGESADDGTDKGRREDEEDEEEHCPKVRLSKDEALPRVSRLHRLGEH